VLTLSKNWCRDHRVQALQIALGKSDWPNVRIDAIAVQEWLLARCEKFGGYKNWTEFLFTVNSIGKAHFSDIASGKNNTPNVEFFLAHWETALEVYMVGQIGLAGYKALTEPPASAQQIVLNAMAPASMKQAVPAWEQDLDLTIGLLSWDQHWLDHQQGGQWGGENRMEHLQKFSKYTPEMASWVDDEQIKARVLELLTLTKPVNAAAKAKNAA